MIVTKKDLGKSQIELVVEISAEEFKPYFEKGAEAVSKEVKIDGFRPGKVPIDVLKSKIGEMSILEESARIAINKTVETAIKDNVAEQLVGQPQINITKLAPENPLEYKIVLAVLPKVELGEYKDLKIKVDKQTVAESEMDKMLNDLRELKVSEAAVDREIKEGDKVIANVQMFLDNVPLEGGQANEVAIVIGKNYFVPGFDKQLLGMKKGETREFKLPYPEDFHQKNLAGKMVEFKAVAKDIFERLLPELDDDLAKSFGSSDIDDLKKNIKKSLLERKEMESSQKGEIAMLEKIITKTKFGDLPELLINHETDAMLAELEHSVNEQGGRFEDYLSSIKKTKDQLTLDMLPDAIKRVKMSLIIREIAILEKIKVGEKEIEENIEHMKKHYKGNKELEERLMTPEYKIYAENMLTNRKVIEKLKEWNFVKDEKDKETENK
jgi:trigger factor